MNKNQKIIPNNEDILNVYPDCQHPWNKIAGYNTKEYQYDYCMECGDIQKFYWKSIWRRIKSLFNK